MARFTAEVEVDAPAAAVWERMVDWPAHGRWVPLTTVRVLTPRGDGVGARFVGRTSLAAVGLPRVGFDDVMEVTEWSPPGDGRPGRCSVRKLGRVLRGTAAFDVVEIGPAGDDSPGRTRVLWAQEVRIPPVALTRPLDRLVALVSRLGYTAVLRTMARELT